MRIGIEKVVCRLLRDLEIWGYVYVYVRDCAEGI